jgi:hypothetical protein
MIYIYIQTWDEKTVILRANVQLFCIFESLGAEELKREACPVPV